MKIQHDAKGKDVNPHGYSCTFKDDQGNICGKVFATRHKLNQHKSQVGHKVKRRRKEDSSEDQ